MLGYLTIGLFNWGLKCLPSFVGIGLLDWGLKCLESQTWDCDVVATECPLCSGLQYHDGIDGLGTRATGLSVNLRYTLQPSFRS